MLRLLFWNINQNVLASDINYLVDRHQIDFLILAEDPLSAVERQQSLPVNGSVFAFADSQSRINILSRFDASYFQPIQESEYYSFQGIALPLHKSLTLLAIHWKSLMNRSEASQSAAMYQLGREIRDVEKEIGHERTIVVGDLNVNPFLEGMVASNGMHSVMCKEIVARGNRSSSPYGKFPFFYNPTWSILGDESLGPPGTYYYNNSQEVQHFWNIFDQVLVRPDLIEFLPKRSLRVLTESQRKLVDHRGLPSVSDHLPLFFQFDLPLGEN